MKLNNFSSALPDLNEVLKRDPENIKALYRRAKCKYVLRMYNEVGLTFALLFYVQ